MKAIVTIVTILTLLSCKNNHTQEQGASFLPEDTILVTFDLNEFNEKKTALFDFSDATYSYVDANGVSIVQTQTDEGFKEQRTYPDSLFIDVFLFYPNGTLKCKYKTFTKGGFVAGRIIHYTKQGKISKVENSDEPYLFSLDKVLDYLKSNNVDINDSTFYVKINRLYVDEVGEIDERQAEELPPPPNPNLKGLEGLYVWHIELYLPHFRQEDIYLDSQTGEVLKEIHRGESGSFRKTTKE